MGRMDADTFDEKLLRALASRGLMRDGDGRWVRSPSYAGPNAPTDEQIRFLNASADQPAVNARLKRQWVENFREICSTLAAKGLSAPWPFTAVFWLRLQGILVDLRGEHDDLFRTLEVDPATYQAGPGSVLEHAFGVFRAIEALRGTLTEDELIYADYRRHAEAHPNQTSYDVRWSKKAAKISDRRAVPAVGREFTVEELSAAIRRVLASQPGEPAVAVALARRVLAAAEALVRATRPA